MMTARLRPPGVDASAETFPLNEASLGNEKPAMMMPRGKTQGNKFGPAARARMYAKLCTPFLEEEDRIGVRRSGCMSTLGVRLAILVPFLVSVSFATGIFLYRAEIQNGLMPQGTNQWSSTTNLNGATSEGEPEYGITSDGNYDTSLEAPEPAAEAEADDETKAVAAGSEPLSTTSYSESENAAPATMPEAEPEEPASAQPEPSITPTENKRSPVEGGDMNAESEGEAESEQDGTKTFDGDSNPEAPAGVEGKDVGAALSTAEAEGDALAMMPGSSDDNALNGAESEAEAETLPEAEAEAEAVAEAEAATTEAEAEAEAKTGASVVIGASSPSPQSSDSTHASMPDAEPEAPAAAAAVPVQSPQAARRSSPVPRRGLVSKSGQLTDTAPTSESEPAHFEINDTVSSFVGNMGLVFGLIYAFVFGRSYSRFDSIMSTFYGEVAAMHKLVLLVQTVQLPEKVMQNMIEFLKHYADDPTTQHGDT